MSLGEVSFYGHHVGEDAPLIHVSLALHLLLRESMVGSSLTLLSIVIFLGGGVGYLSPNTHLLK